MIHGKVELYRHLKVDGYTRRSNCIVLLKVDSDTREGRTVLSFKGRLMHEKVELYRHLKVDCDTREGRTVSSF